MKDLKNLLIYGGGSLAVILILSNLSAITGSTGGLFVVLAVVLVVVLPIVLIIEATKRKKNQEINE